MSGLRPSTTVTNLAVDSLRLRSVTQPGLLVASDSGFVSVGTAPTLVNLVVTGTSMLGTSAIVMGPLTANSVNALTTLSSSSLAVSGNASIGGALSAASGAFSGDVSVGGNASLAGDLSVGGNESLAGDLGVGGSVAAASAVLSGDLGVGGSVAAESVVTGVLDVSSAFIANVVINSASISNISVTGISVTNGSFTMLDVSDGFITNLVSTNGSIAMLDVSNGSITNLTSTDGLIANITSTNGSIANLDVSNGTVTNLDVSSGVVTTHGIPITVPTGSITMFAGLAPPNGWLFCDGSAVSRTTYASLFSLITTYYGDGDSLTTFNIPNMVNYLPMGAGNLYGLGSKGGATTKTLATTEIPAHTHDVSSVTSAAAGSHDHTVSGTTDPAGSHQHGFQVNITEGANSGGPTTTPKWGYGDNIDTLPYTGNTFAAGGHVHPYTGSTNTASDHQHTIPGSTTTSTGGGSAFSILPPYIAMYYIIKY